ncbi:MAG: hypothetical protein RL456_2745 [Pseudomonadota bacterium]|jgi:hypothetical protein
MRQQDNLPLHPIWREAAMKAADIFAYGEVIPHEWLRTELQVPDRQPNDILTTAQHRAMDFDLLSKVEGFKDEMLREHNRLLVNVRGGGYRIVPAPSQTDAAMGRLRIELRKAMVRAKDALVHIDMALLEQEDAQRNAEARAKLAAFAAMGQQSLSQPEARKLPQ